MRQRLRELDDARDATALDREAEACRCGRLAARHVVLESCADVVEAVQRGAAKSGRRVVEAPTQLDLRTEALVAGNLGDLEAAAEPVAADLESLAVRQRVRSL